MVVLLVHRAEEFSPNNVVKDAKLLEAVEARLKQLGHTAMHVREEDLLSTESGRALEEADAVISMARRFASLMKLERCGKRVLNLPNGVRRALSRETTLDLLTDAQVPVPPYWAQDPAAEEMFLCERRLQSLLPGWVKGMHPRGVRAGDVQYVADAMSADSRIITMVAEGYTDIVVTRHLPGFVVKAYCVSGELIHWMLPQQSGYTKFGDEAYNDAPELSMVDVAQLSALAQTIGQVMQLQIYGFDVIVSGPDRVYVIDVNDAPSFSSCRDLAAEKIVKLI